MSTTRILEVRTSREGVFRIEIPADYKVTFSKVNPAQNGYGGEMALRIYESDDKQRACFTDVVSFRDTSLPFKRRIKKTKERVESERTGKKRRVERESSAEHEWVDGDEDTVEHDVF